MTRTDLNLGLAVHDYLIAQGVETPMTNLRSSYDNEDRIKVIKNCFTAIMDTLFLDLTDDSLKDTPARVAKMFINEIFWGLDYNNFPKCTTVENKMNYDEMVVVRNANVQSQCEHHFVVIDGFAQVAYIPKEKVLGLSKINRIVQFFSKRPQIQERLTAQIFHALCFILDTENVAVIIEANHFCVKSRGIQDANSDTVTSKLGGVFMQHEVKAEFLKLIKK